MAVFADQEVDVPRESGPTIARWQLARELKSLRESAKLSHQDIAAALGCSDWKIYKMESGDVGIGRPDLMVMLDRYGVTDEQHRATLFDLQKQGKERGWWAKYGQLPSPYGQLIGLEGAATTIRNFQLAVIPGLLQTEEYARSLFEAQLPNHPPEEIERRIKVRMKRQEALVEDPPLEFWTILDEGAIRRQMGGRLVMRAQLSHLLQMAKRPNVTVQVLPFSEGGHPGTLGSLALLDFPDDVHSPVAYVETFAGDVYLEKEEDMKRVTVVYTHLQAAALSVTKSKELIAAVASELA